MNQDFHDHLDVCVQCRTHPLDLCRAGVKLLYQQAMGEPVSVDAVARAEGRVTGQPPRVPESSSSDTSTLGAPPAPPQWHPIATAPKGRKVLVSWLNALGKRRTTFAVYFEADTLDMEDEYDGGIDEEGRNAEAGWFEDREAGEPSYYELKEPLTHWMPLPKPPTSFPAPPAPPANEEPK